MLPFTQFPWPRAAEKKAIHRFLSCGEESGGDKLAPDNVEKDVRKNLPGYVRARVVWKPCTHQRG